jgi:hypothetical protein
MKFRCQKSPENKQLCNTCDSLCGYFVTLCDFELSDLDLQFVNKIGVCVLVSINLSTYLW